MRIDIKCVVEFVITRFFPVFTSLEIEIGIQIDIVSQVLKPEAVSVRIVFGKSLVIKDVNPDRIITGGNCTVSHPQIAYISIIIIQAVNISFTENEVFFCGIIDGVMVLQ